LASSGEPTRPSGARPQDAIEELLTHDVFDLTWEILRMRRVKAGVLSASMYEGVESVMRRLAYDDTRMERSGASRLLKKSVGKALVFAIAA
jgi:hypothetical protein